MNTRMHLPPDHENFRENMQDLVSHIAEYVDTQKQLFQINAAQKVAATVSGGVSALVMAVLGLLVLLFL
ncbi:MAG TPA: hypothetical protein PKD78_15190, partial [Saprospiraceae bacterium]|nr:hypothetical protein [Saprospiraceae bacterium]